MTLLACWVAFPLILLALAHGAGTLIGWAAGRELPAGVRIPSGLALIMAVLDLATRSSSTATLAVPAVVILGVAGLAVGLAPGRWSGRGDGPTSAHRFSLRPAPEVVAAAVVFAVYAAPIVLSGQATWAGYIKLDDTATWLALVDRALEHGHSLAGLPTSTYRDVLANYLVVGYPLGSFLPLGIGHELLGQDIAWLTDPWMATMAAALTLALAHIARRALPNARRWAPAVIAALAAQAALLYGYYLWGGMKELAGAVLVAAFAVTAALPLEGERRLRATIPLLVVLWSLVAALSPGGLIWAGPGALLTLAVALAVRRTMPRLSAPMVAGGAVLVVLGGYLVLRPGGFVERFQSVLTGGDQLGNLVAPLNLLQIVGIWPSSDFRDTPSALTITHALIGLALVAAAGGLYVAVRRSRLELLLYSFCALAGALLVDLVASPWLAGKALATAAPAIPLLALVGAAALAAHRPGIDRVLGIGAGLLVAIGILWSSVLGYHGVSLAPAQQYAELSAIGQRIAGQGPTLMTEYNPYGARHFLRDAAPESASELRTRVIPLLSGQPLPKGSAADIDQFQLSAVLVYRTIVLQRSPTQSRPPSPYRLVYEDRWWQVWQRPTRIDPPIVAHLPLGDVIAPGAVPGCSSVVALGREPGVATLIGAPVTDPVVVSVAVSRHPATWTTGASYLSLSVPGTAQIPVSVPVSGRYSVWLGGSIHTPTAIAVDGRRVGSADHDEQEAAQYVNFGDITLRAGAHVVQLSHSRGLLAPGTGGPPDVVGPLVLRLDVPNPPLVRVPAAAATRLCGQTLDWVEAIGR